MRIVQIIDSLEAGGAERMAVNYANGLAKRIDFSGLIATRNEGSLKDAIDNGVNYFFLNKKRTLDFIALFKLKNYCKKNRIEYIHAHSSSYFIAFLLKLIVPKIKIIWHDHDGMSEFLDQRKTFPIMLASFFFEGIITVNLILKKWAIKNLKCKKVIFFSNFTSFETKVKNETLLMGSEGKRIVCLANLRPQKNHFLLIEIAKNIKNSFPDWSFHLVGKDFHDTYSKKIKDLIVANNLKEQVFIYDSKRDIQNIISQCDFGILTSKSEGLPLCLLEFGSMKKTVVASDVGEIGTILKNKVNGFLIEKNNEKKFSEAIIALIQDEHWCKTMGDKLGFVIEQNHSENKILMDYVNWINNVKKC